MSTEDTTTVSSLATSHTITEGGNLAPCQVTGRTGSFPVLAMIDTGNDTRPSGVVLSKTFVEELGLTVIPVPHTRVNTASRGASMTVVGQVKNVRMFLLNEYLVESILVLEGLSHPVNIGLKFLQKNYAIMYLSPEKVTLEMGQVQVDLVKKGVTVK